jgi:hypothetical protein
MFTFSDVGICAQDRNLKRAAELVKNHVEENYGSQIDFDTLIWPTLQ